MNLLMVKRNLTHEFIQRIDIYVVQKTLRELKNNISTQSKNNFLLEKDVRFLDSRIALLIQNRMALDEVYVVGQCYNILLTFVH